MEENMLDNVDDIENRVRERAFQLWQEAGCPEGRAEEFWHRAREIELGLSGPTDKQIDEAGDDSFPASDPTSFAEF
jgi:hypothetical protein